jgi:thymidylate synthase (FAD)
MLSVELLSHSGSDLDIADAALVSSGKTASRSIEQKLKLVERLVRDGHLSCLEHVTFKFRIKCPQRIQTQILRHRVGMSFNCASARYGFEFSEVYFPHINSAYTPELRHAYAVLEACSREAMEAYKEVMLMTESLLREDKSEIRDAASFGLPQGTMTEMIVSCNLRSLNNFVVLRDTDKAQSEIQKIAQDMWNEVCEIPELRTAVAALDNVP